jgi:ornithine cyclodeaminase/alanine dehydrogenase
MTLFLDDATVQSVFDWGSAVTALRDAYGQDVGGSRYPARTMARGERSWLRALTGAPADTGLMGAKLIAASQQTRRASYLIPLFDQATAELVALLDGHSITGYRTAATSALAADLLCSPGPLDVALIGSGFEAKHHVRALAAVRELKSVAVFSPRTESRARFASDLADLGSPIRPADTPETAVAGASLVICAARARDERPTLHGTWLEPGQTVVSIGSTLPEQREVDPHVLARADVVVADMVDEVLQDTGDAIAAREAGVDVAAKTVSLADLVGGRHPGRTGSDELLVYKSVGSAVQDLAVAAICARTAGQGGLGQHLPVTITPVQK